MGSSPGARGLEPQPWRGSDRAGAGQVPLVGTVKELEHQAALIRRVAGEVFAERKDTVAFRVGTMIEIPRAALLADDIAKVRRPRRPRRCPCNLHQPPPRAA